MIVSMNIGFDFLVILFGYEMLIMLDEIELKENVYSGFNNSAMHSLK